MGQLETDGDAHQHSEASLLGHQRADRRGPLCGVLDPGHPRHLAGLRLAEPAAGVQRLVEDALEPGRRVGDDLLGMGEPVGVGRQCRHGGVDLLGGEATVGHGLCDHTGVAIVPRLTSLSHGAGCGCKLPASALAPLVAALPAGTDPRVLVDASTSDDAGVVLVSPQLALVQTADFFTPIVDDPYDFGRIAATNALSDIYAMGATPLSALNLVAFPLEALGADVLLEILRGGHDAVTAAGASIVGGHSIDDPEPKYGLAVTGLVHPDELLTNAGGRPGDALVLTKPLGAGVVSTAVKRGLADDALLARAVEVMTTLNAQAAADAREAGAHALTDVTGFGLLGHLHELALASGCAAEVEAAAVPAIDGVLELLAGEQAIAGGTRRNRAHAEEFATFADGVAEPLRWLVCDAMTSGGLLAATPSGLRPGGPTSAGHVAGSGTLMGEMPGARVGRLVDGAPGTISVT